MNVREAAAWLAECSSLLIARLPLVVLPGELLLPSWQRSKDDLPSQASPPPPTRPRLANPPGPLPRVSRSACCLFCKAAIYSFIYVWSALMGVVGAGNESPRPVQELYQRPQGGSHTMHRPGVTVTLALRWPVSQSETKISVRCQPGTCCRRAPHTGPRGWAAPLRGQ